MSTISSIHRCRRKVAQWGWEETLLRLNHLAVITKLLRGVRSRPILTIIKTRTTACPVLTNQACITPLKLARLKTWWWLNGTPSLSRASPPKKLLQRQWTKVYRTLSLHIIFHSIRGPSSRITRTIRAWSVQSRRFLAVIRLKRTKSWRECHLRWLLKLWNKSQRRSNVPKPSWIRLRATWLDRKSTGDD